MSFNLNKVQFLLNKFLWKVVELFKSIFEIISVQKRHKKSNMSEQENIAKRAGLACLGRRFIDFNQRRRQKFVKIGITLQFLDKI